MYCDQGFHLLGGAGGDLLPQTLNLPTQVQITCQYKVPTKWMRSIKGILPPQTKNPLIISESVSYYITTSL